MPSKRTTCLCHCGCGEMTKGGIFVHGHSARVLSPLQVKPLDERFRAKVAPADTPDGCRLWTGNTNNYGYGMLYSHGRRVLATHVALELIGVVIPPGGCVLHKCDVPLCVNTDHLVVGDRKDNSHDMWSKGRSNWQKGAHPDSRGERNTNAKLNAEIVREIRATYAAGGHTLRTLAKLFNVHASSVGRILARKTWRHVN